MGVDTAWTVGEHLAAVGVDLQAGANWQRGGGKGKKPDPIPRPQEARAAREKLDRTFAKAARFRAVKGAPTPRADPHSKPDRPRDERGRFISKEA